MKSAFIIGILLALLIIPISISAEDNETVNQTIPVILTFTGGHPWGENPIQVINNITGGIVYIGNTSSRNITVEPDRGYILRVEPAGLIDAAHSSDSALIGMSEFVGKNPLGSIFISLILGAFISAYRRQGVN